MSRKDLSKVYDMMKPDEEEKREMYRKIKQKADAKNVSEESSREINVVTYSKKSGAAGFAKFALTAACAGLIVFGGIQMIQKNAEPVTPGNTDENSGVSETTEITGAGNPEHPENEFDPEKNDTVLTDSDKSYRAESVMIPDPGFAVGMYNGNIIYNEHQSFTEYTCRPVNNADENIVFLDSEGNPLSDIYGVSSGKNYIAVNHNTEDIYIYDMNLNLTGIINAGPCYDVIMGADDTVYYLTSAVTDEVVKTDTEGNVLGTVSLDDLLPDYVQFEFIFDIYVTKDGRLAVESTGNENSNGYAVYLLSEDFDLLGNIPLSESMDILGEYNGSLVLRTTDYTADNRYFMADIDENNFSRNIYNAEAFSNTDTVFKGCGDYYAFTVENDMIFGYKPDEEQPEFIGEIPGISGTDYIDFFNTGRGICSNANIYSDEYRYYSVPADDGEVKNITFDDDLRCFWYEEVTETGHLRAVSDIDPLTAKCTAADIDLATGEKKFTDLFVNPAKGIMQGAVYTDNFTALIVSDPEIYSNDSGEIYSNDLCCVVYNSSGEEVDFIRGVNEVFSLEESDVLVYYVPAKSNWVLMDLNTGATVSMTNDIPMDSFIYQGRGIYDFFFRGEGGIYGGVIDGTEFRYSMVVDFEKLEIPEDIVSGIVNLDEPITSEYIYKFFYEDEENIYIGTKGWCDCMKLVENK